MPRTLEEILKSKGFADADLAGMSTLLADNRFRGAVEGLETERESFQTRDAEWNRLHSEKWQPTVRTLEGDLQQARLDLAQEREKVKIARDFGYLDEDGDKKATAAAAKAKEELESGARRGGGFNADDPEFQKFAGRFSQAEGDAIAVHNFLAEEYRSLHGTSINEYRGQDGKRGMIALRAEAQAVRKPIDQYTEEKFGWAAKRQAAEQQRAKDFEDGIRKNEREKFMLEQGLSINPDLARHVPSRQPFIPQKAEGKGQPWEKSSQSLAADRRNRATQTQIKSTVN